MKENIKPFLTVGLAVVLYVLTYWLARKLGLPLNPMPNPLMF